FQDPTMSLPSRKPLSSKDENKTSEDFGELSRAVSETSEVYHRRWWARWRPDQQWEAYLFLLPSFAGLLIFVALPVVAALALSFVRWNLLSPPTFVGTANYAQLLTHDPIFRKALWNTAYFTVTIVPLQLVFG
ncbi:unnamed protein product, partial [marine sediment metagenome]